MWYAFIGLFIGIVAGYMWPYALPPQYGRLLAVAVMAGMDTVLGGVRASMEGTYDEEVFISGFFVNGLLAAFLCYAANMIGIDLYLVAILIFGMRVFQNLTIIRKLYLGKFEK